MRLLRVVGSLTLPCGCLVGRYETYSGKTVSFIDSRSERCEVEWHRVGRTIAVAQPQGNQTSPFTTSPPAQRSASTAPGGRDPSPPDRVGGVQSRRTERRNEAG
jgi:hypothetical protein